MKKPRTLTYWVAYHIMEPCFTIRGRTKKEVQRELNHRTCIVTDYEKPIKVRIEYYSLLNLIDSVLGEGGESTATYEGGIA